MARRLRDLPRPEARRVVFEAMRGIWSCGPLGARGPRSVAWGDNCVLLFVKGYVEGVRKHDLGLGVWPGRGRGERGAKVWGIEKK